MPSMAESLRRWRKKNLKQCPGLVDHYKGQMVRLYWGLIRKEYEANNGRNFLKGAHVILLLGGIFFLPFHAVQNFTYAIAKRRSRSRWPELIRERLEPDGPTTRLVDLEQHQAG